MGSGVSREQRGVFLGTGAALDIEVGFRPRHVHLINLSSADEAKWAEYMDDGSMHKRLAAGSATVVSSNGVTPTDSGFTLGPDSDMNVSGEKVLYICVE